MSIAVSILTSVSDKAVLEINQIRQEVSSSGSVSKEQLAATVRDTTVFVAENEQAIVGMAILVLANLPGGLISYIENVGVRQTVRKQGVGEALVQSMLEHAKELNVKSINLTTNPTREAANRLYGKLGFKQRDTNVYRYTF